MRRLYNNLFKRKQGSNPVLNRDKISKEFRNQINEEFEKYSLYADYLGSYPSEYNRPENEIYVEKVIDRLFKIYDILRDEAGLETKQLLDNPELRTPEMQECTRVLEKIIIKTIRGAIRNDTCTGAYKQD